MMPPNAQNISTTASNAVSDAHVIAGTNDDTINFNTSAIDHTQSEVAKTFHWREFGNGNANGGEVSGSTGGNYKDFSMLSSGTAGTDMAFVMDDGLTSISTDDYYYHSTYGLLRYTTGDKLYLTFIGTGISWNTSLGIKNWVQNLPYGTHVLELVADSSDADEGTVKIDGVAVKSDFDDSGDPNNTIQLRKWHPLDDITFHQPKRPPIPEDACVIADYMLMADYVANTGTGQSAIGKGVRFVDASRDIFYDQGGSTWQFQMLTDKHNGFRVFNDASSTSDYKLPFFGHGITYRSQSHTDRVNEAVFKINDDVYDTNFNSAGNYVAGNRIGTASPNPWDTTNNDGTFTFRHSSSTNREEFVGVKELQLGLNELHIDAPQYINVTTGMEVHTPIHTSSHYQTFETPYLHELVGGDRNMEQTNLVVSSDGKTWDEVTRDVSYIGNQCVSTAPPQTQTAPDAHPRTHTRWRGTEQKSSNWRVKTWLNKDFAIAYNSVICLKDGNYRFTYTIRTTTGVDAAGTFGIILNDAGTANSSVTGHIFRGYHSDANQVMTLTGNYYLKRGDVISWQGPSLDLTQDIVQIERVK